MIGFQLTTNVPLSCTAQTLRLTESGVDPVASAVGEIKAKLKQRESVT